MERTYQQREENVSVNESLEAIDEHGTQRTRFLMIIEIKGRSESQCLCKVIGPS